MDQRIVFDKHLTKSDLLVLRNLAEDVKENSVRGDAVLDNGTDTLPGESK